MGTISVSLPSDGSTADVADYNTPITTVVNAINGNLDNANIATGAAIDGAKIASSSLTSSQMATSVSPVTRWSEGAYDFVASGCVWSGDSYGSTLAASMTSGVVYLSGKRLTVATVTARAFTASKDTYVDLSDNGDGTAAFTYTEVANNAASPALASGSLRLAIIVSGGSSIAAVGSINQGQETKVLPIASSIPYAVTDSLGNLICPRDANRKILGFRMITSTFTDNSGTTTQKQITGLSVPVIVPTNRKIKISVFTEDIGTNVGASTTLLTIWDGVVASGTQIAASRHTTTAASSLNNGSLVTAIITPSSASKTYNAGLNADNGGTPPFIEASATAPAFILVELV